MNVVDPRELGDRDFFIWLLVGELPRRGWSGRGRAIARRMFEVVGLTAAVIVGLVIVSIAIVLVWAGTLPA